MKNALLIAVHDDGTVFPTLVLDAESASIKYSAEQLHKECVAGRNDDSAGVLVLGINVSMSGHSDTIKTADGYRTKIVVSYVINGLTYTVERVDYDDHGNIINAGTPYHKGESQLTLTGPDGMVTRLHVNRPEGTEAGDLEEDTIRALVPVDLVNRIDLPALVALGNDPVFANIIANKGDEAVFNFVYKDGR